MEGWVKKEEGIKKHQLPVIKISHRIYCIAKGIESIIE